MREVVNQLKEADKRLKNTSYILNVTYPMIQDKKLFIPVLENIDKSLKLTLNSLLMYERFFKRISPYADNFEIKLEILKKLISRSYPQINGLTPSFIKEINDLTLQRKSAPMEFPRREGFVIADERYRVKVLKYEDLLSYYSKAKIFISQTSNIITNGVNKIWT